MTATHSYPSLVGTGEYVAAYRATTEANRARGASRAERAVGQPPPDG